MSDKSLNLLSLEKELTSISEDALADEQKQVSNNYQLLEKEKKDIVIPFPDVHSYDVGVDYDDISDIQYKKGRNQPAWNSIALIDSYLNASRLFIGHCLLNNGSNYYIIDCLTSKFQIHKQPIHLINVDDKDYTSIIRAWRYPAEDKAVNYSRNIHMHNRHVDAVDVVFDSNSQVASGITDFFLRKALLRNKDKASIGSIIQTIQEKQDTIRTLPKEQSFIVQGCAGSGKTMVLLHRLRYLLFNDEISSNEYLLLIPTTGFGSFIKDTCAQFRIQASNILPIQSYYKKLVGEKSIDASSDASELVFSPDYLKRIYSREFLQEACRDLVANFSMQMEDLTSYCDDALNAKLAQAKEELEAKINQVTQDGLLQATSTIQLVAPYVQTKLKTLQDVSVLISELRSVCDKTNKEYQHILNENPLLFLSTEEIIAADASLQLLQNEITTTEEKVARASIFTVNAQRKKLANLKERYQNHLHDVMQQAEAVERKRLQDKAAKARFVYADVSLEDAERILSDLSQLYATHSQVVAEAQNALEHIEDTLTKRFSKEVSLLQRIIESPSVSEACSAQINALEPLTDSLFQYIQIGSELYKTFYSFCETRERKQMETHCRFYKSRSEQECASYVNQLLLNTCKRKIHDEFNIAISRIYKHYWYLVAYCRYLTKGIDESPRKYLFVDEAQDLSVSEIELLHKVNIVHGVHSLTPPVLNLFGDVHQMITQHGISDWRDIRFIADIYTLNENFRNTNQIVDYCNAQFPFTMEKVGVDLEAVCQFPTLSHALPTITIHKVDIVYIVKDDYAKKDLHDLLYQNRFYTYDAYTVKEAKGLEFKWVCVFDDGMTSSEAYIAYTRALVGLIVVKELPRIECNHTSLIVSGTDSNDEVAE